MSSRTTHPRADADETTGNRRQSEAVPAAPPHGSAMDDLREEDPDDGRTDVPVPPHGAAMSDLRKQE